MNTCRKKEEMTEEKAAEKEKIPINCSLLHYLLASISTVAEKKIKKSLQAIHLQTPWLQTPGEKLL